eukprot:7412200-Pyramimonas_sp.AAC.1
MTLAPRPQIWGDGGNRNSTIAGPVISSDEQKTNKQKNNNNNTKTNDSGSGIDVRASEARLN